MFSQVVNVLGLKPAVLVKVPENSVRLGEPSLED